MEEKKKAVVFDSSTIISLVLNGLFIDLKTLKQNFNGYFLLTKEVREEVITKPLGIKRFKLEALKVQQMLRENIFQTPEVLGINEDEVTRLTQELMKKANYSFLSKKKEIEIIAEGETSCLALSKILKEKGVENILAIDERTIRLLVEKPENLRELLEKRLHVQVKVINKNFKEFQGFKIVRSSELMFLLYKRKLLRWTEEGILDAILWGLKLNGCAISREEIEEIEQN